MTTKDRRIRFLSLLGSAATLGLALTGTAEAGAFAIREQSAYGQGMSFAGAAAGGSLSSMFWNPATLSAVMGFQTESVYSGLFPTSDVTVETFTTPTGVTLPLEAIAPGADRDQGDIGIDALVPSSYAGYRISDNVIVGVGLNGPFGLSTKYDYDSVLREGGRYNPLLRNAGIAGTSEVFSLNVNPNVAWQVNQYLTLALGAQVQYIDVRLTSVGLTRTGAPGGGLGFLVGLPGQNRFSFEGDDIGLGLTAGIQVRPFEGTEIGLGYRSRIDHEIDAELCSYTTPEVCRDVTGEEFDLPDMVSFGIRQRIGGAFTLAGTVEWTNWSRFETVNVTGFSPLAPEIPFEFGYDDGWFASLGGEYQATEALAVRAGIGYEWSPLDEENRTFRLPDNDRLWLSAGATYAYNERFSFDLGYSAVIPEETDILAAPLGGPDANGSFSGESDAIVHIVAGAVKVKLDGLPFFGSPAAEAVEAPIVAKY